VTATPSLPKKPAKRTTVQSPALPNETKPSGIKPTGIESFLDKAQVWLPEPLSASNLAELKSLCRGKVHKLKKWVRFNHKVYKQRLQLNQPTREALQLLNAQAGVLINYLEISLDWLFDNYWICECARETHDQCRIRKYHGKQGIRNKNGTTYDAYRWKNPNGMVCYSDRPSKATGEIFCVHTDWMISRAAAIRRAGINSLADLLALDLHDFWSKRLILAEVDRSILGRLYQNYILNTRRRSPWLEERRGSNGQTYLYNVDAYIGTILYRRTYTDPELPSSTQAVIDRYRYLEVSRCLIPLDIRHLLPPVGSFIL
jgi:hypothetical protein